MGVVFIFFVCWKKEEGMSRKREREEEDTVPNLSRNKPEEEEDEDNLMFEDPFEDEIEEEIIVDDNDAMEEDGDDAEEQPKQVWRPNVDKLNDGEFLDYDSSAYDMFHVLNTDWPCLSLDILQDTLGFKRSKFPHTVYFVAGTQAGVRSQNKIFVFKASDLHKTRHDDNSDDDDDDDEDFDDDPILESRFIKHDGCVNRIRAMPQQSNIIATMADTGAVHIWDIAAHLKSLDQPGRIANIKPVKTFSGHASEGYAVNWSTVSPGRLVSIHFRKTFVDWRDFNFSTLD